MEKNNGSSGTSWADQWDYGSDPVPATTGKNSGSGSAKSKATAGLEKTKAVAATGMKKVKEGTTLGVQWIKEKYNKRTQKH